MTKIFQGVVNLSTEENLKHLDLHSLEWRRMRGNLIEVYKWLNYLNNGNVNRVLLVNLNPSEI